MGNGEMGDGTVSQFPEDAHFPITLKKISDIVLLHLETVIQVCMGLVWQSNIKYFIVDHYDFKVAEYADARLHVGSLPFLRCLDKAYPAGHVSFEDGNCKGKLLTDRETDITREMCGGETHFTV